MVGTLGRERTKEEVRWLAAGEREERAGFRMEDVAPNDMEDSLQGPQLARWQNSGINRPRWYPLNNCTLPACLTRTGHPTTTHLDAANNALLAGRLGCLRRFCLGLLLILLPRLTLLRCQLRPASARQLRGGAHPQALPRCGIARCHGRWRGVLRARPAGGAGRPRPALSRTRIAQRSGGAGALLLREVT